MTVTRVERTRFVLVGRRSFACRHTRFPPPKGITIVQEGDAWLAGWKMPVPEPRVSLSGRLPRWSGGAVCVRTLGVR